jgi:hypothetical protein
MVPKTLTELVPRESITIPSWVGLPPVKSGASQLPCCVKDSLPIIALRNNQLALHRAKPVVCLEWVRGVREGRRMTPQEIRTPVTGLRRRWRRWLSMDLLQSLNGVVQGAGRTAPGSVVAASVAADQYPGCSAPAGQNRNRCAWCSPSDCNKQNL